MPTTRYRFAVELDADGMSRALDVLVQRFCTLVRARAIQCQCPDLNESASTLSLIAFGHAPTIEGYLRAAARETADMIDPLLDDEGIMSMFASKLPLRVGGEAVRDMFMPVETVEPAAT